MSMAKLLRPYGWIFAAVVLLQIIGAVAGLVPLLAVVELGRTLLASGPVDHDHVWLVVGAGAGGLFVRLLFTAASSGIGHLLDDRVQLAFRRRLAAHLGRVPIGWLAQRRTGELAKVAGDDVSAVHPFIAHTPGELVSAFVVPLVSLAYLFTVDWRLTLITLIPVALAVALVPLMMTPSRLREQKEFDAAMGRIANSAVEFVQGIAVVKAFGGSERAHRRFRTATDGFADVFLRMVRGLSVPARRDRARGLRQRLHREHVPDPADRTPCGLHVVETVAEGGHRSGQPQAQQQEGQQVGGGHAAVRDERRASGQHDQQHERRRDHHLHPRGDPGEPAHHPVEGVDEIVHGRAERAVGALGPAERLDHRDALDELDDGVRDPPHARVELLLLAQPGGCHHQRHQRHRQHHRDQRDQREPPVDGEQVGQRHQRHHERGHELAGRVGDERVHGAHVRADDLRQLTGPAPGEPPDRHETQPFGQQPPERQLHPVVEKVPDP